MDGDQLVGIMPKAPDAFFLSINESRNQIARETYKIVFMGQSAILPSDEGVVDNDK